ncbi:Nephrin [Nymphon striatum]|nr:Nephrin [Nymphon striatum]
MPDLPVCLGALTHRGSLAREAPSSCLNIFFTIDLWIYLFILTWLQFTIHFSFRAILPCNVSSSDNISLVLWYKGSTEEPIYTVDARPDFVGNIQQHFIHANWKKRIDFDLSNKPMAILRMDKVTLADDGIYRCRVDFQHSRTRIYQITLSVIVPPSPPDIVDQMGKKLDGSIGPHDEDGPLRLTCNSFDGKLKRFNDTCFVEKLRRTYMGLSYPGEVTYTESSQIRVNVMEKASTHYKWPNVQDNIFYSYDDVIMKLAPPILSLLKKLVSAQHSMERKILGVSWRDRKTNSWVRTNTWCKDLTQTVKRKPPPRLTWWREGIRLKSGNNEFKRGVVKNTLFIPKLSRKDLHAHLECQASNNNRTSPARNRVILELNLKPKEVRITSSKMPLSASKLVKLSCQSSGSRPPAVLTWWKGSKKMTKAVNTFFEDSNVSKSVLTMVPSSEDNNVYLACRAENPNMSNSAKEDGFKLKIYYIPVVTLVIARPSKTDEPYEGEDVFFDCHAQAVPKRRMVEENTDKTQESIFEEPKIEIDSPVCKNSTTVNYRVSLEETANVLCQVDANPPDVTFHWSFNNTVDHMNMVTFTVDGLDSIARYKASDHDDYGHLLCWAENSVGIQGQPCVFHLTYAGYYRMFVVCCASHFEPARSLSIYHRSCFIKVISYLINCPPEAPINCSVGNGSTSVVEVICYAGYNGGLNQTFVMEVYDEPTRQLRANVTNEEEPRFVARNLPAGSSFYVVVYAANAKGASTSLAVAGHTARSRLYDES